MTEKHTPGPLSIKKAEDSDDPDWAIIDGDGRIIGEAFDLVYFDTHRPAEANAKLWASAPDLLAERDALREALLLTIGGWDAIESNKIRTLSDWEKKCREYARAALDAVEEECHD